MLTVKQCRQILGERSKNMTDEQVVQLRDALHAFANILIDKRLSEQSELDSIQDA